MISYIESNADDNHHGALPARLSATTATATAAPAFAPTAAALAPIAVAPSAATVYRVTRG